MIFGLSVVDVYYTRIDSLARFAIAHHATALPPGIANVIITPDLRDRDRLVITRNKFLLVEGPIQNQDNVIHAKTTRIGTA